MMIAALPMVVTPKLVFTRSIRDGIAALPFFYTIANQFLYIDVLYDKVYDAMDKIVLY